jgi:hypothetical protein
MRAINAALLCLPVLADAGTSIRFFGNGTGDIDRIKIPIVAANNVGADFTLEFWMRASASENQGVLFPGDDGWTTGNTILDRDVFGPGDRGDWGVSTGNGGRIGFGVNDGRSGVTLISRSVAADGRWRHVALVRERASGRLRIFLDGALDAETIGPTGDLAYRLGRDTVWPNDPFLVLGAEKHDYGPEYPSYRGYLDDLRISVSARYSAPFRRPSRPHPLDDATVGLWRLDEGGGPTAIDQTGASDGVVRYGGDPFGPRWSRDIPFARPARTGPAP